MDLGTMVAGRYRIEGAALPGPGASTHYPAVDTRLDRACLLHIVPGEEVRTGPTAQVHRDVEIRASLRHPALVSVLDAGPVSVDGRSARYVVEEAVEGDSLASVIDDHPAGVDADRVRRWAVDLAGGLAVLHAQGGVHGGVDGRAVIIDDDDRARLVQVIDLTEDGRARAASPPDDVLALGRLLLGAVSDDEAPLPSWGAVLVAMTAVDPTARPTAAAAARDITDRTAHRWARGVIPGDTLPLERVSGVDPAHDLTDPLRPVPASPPPSSGPVPEPVVADPRPTRNRRFGFVVAGLGLLLIVGGGVGLAVSGLGDGGASGLDRNLITGGSSTTTTGAPVAPPPTTRPPIVPPPTTAPTTSTAPPTTKKPATTTTTKPKSKLPPCPTATTDRRDRRSRPTPTTEPTDCIPADDD